MDQSITRMKYLRKRSSNLLLENGFIAAYVSGEDKYKYFIYFDGTSEELLKKQSEIKDWWICESGLGVLIKDIRFIDATTTTFERLEVEIFFN